MLLEALTLGLSTGTYCAVSCAPVALPLFVSDEASGGENAARVGLFMGGRLAAYVLIGFLLGAVGAYAAGYLAPALRSVLTRSAAALGGAVLIAAGIARGTGGHRACVLLRRAAKPGRAAFAAGIATGLSPCAPFFAAASRAAGTGGAAGAAYFGAFFIGTSLWFLPLFGVHAVSGRAPELRRVARLGMIALGVYFLAVPAVMGAR